MYYFLLQPYLMYKWILILAAVLPAAFLLVKVYKSDRIEHESGFLLGALLVAGVLSTLPAMVEERIGEFILNALVAPDSGAYDIILYFVIVGFAEESSKYFLMKRRTWNNGEFNCQYDGIVYAVFTSLGFALWENINYVLNYGFGTALVRAVTAIPGHACFGVFMGIFYGMAKKADYRREESASKILRILTVVIPALIHGSYDYVASQETGSGDLGFLAFIALLFVLSLVLINHASRNDRYI